MFPLVDNAEGGDENQPHNSTHNSTSTANQDVVIAQLAAMQQYESQGQSHIAPAQQPLPNDVTRRLDSLEKLVAEQRDAPPPHHVADSIPHPLNTNITLEPYPAGFKIPQLETYDGTKNPDDHLHTFYSYMQDQNASDTLIRRLIKKTTSELMQVKQRNGESLKNYMSKISDAVLEISSFDQAVGITTVISGLNHERFRDSLLKHPATTFSEMNDRSLKFITAEEYALSQKPAPSKNQNPDRFGRPNSAPPQQSAGKPLITWTPFNLPRSQIFMQIKNKMDLRHPDPMRTAIASRNHTRYCDFHQDHGHTTEQCNSLREQGPQPQGIRNPPNRQGVGHQQAPPPLLPLARIIHMITRGLEVGGLSSKQRNLYVREVKHQNRAQKRKLDDADRKDQPITFTPADFEGVVTPHNDPLVTSIMINNCQVQRVLVDTRSAPDIMYYHCFESLGLDPTLLQRYDGPIYGFNNQPVPIEGILTMNVTFAKIYIYIFLYQIMILKYKLTHPSGTPTAYLINSFHTPTGAKLAKKQVALLFSSFSFSFVFAFFQWFFTASDDCGFINFPTFGMQAFKKRFYFDFSSTYVGVGMLFPYMVNVSLLIGAIISWGIMWPMIENNKGVWYSADLSPGSLHGIQGYRIFIAIAMMLGDGLYHVLVMLLRTLWSLVAKSIQYSDKNFQFQNYDEERRTEFFLKDQIPGWVALGGYLVLAAISTISVPFMCHIVTYAMAPVLAFCNAYGCGLTDWSLASNYGKLAIIIFSSWVGMHHGGIIAGLASCGVMMSIVSTASDLMQDFKTGYLTLSSPRSLFFSQVLGTAMGCLITPLVFWFFFKAYPVGDPDDPYPAPYGLLYRGIALLGTEGVSSLPKHCLTLSIGFFIASIVLNLFRQVLQKVETKYQIYRFIPSPMCMAIPLYLGGYFAIDMCIGSLILFLWERKNKQKATDYAPAVASGLICGESLWSVPAAILSLANLTPPICMKLFLSGAANVKVDNFLNGS
ncbi:hypothetical protein SLEP1_g22805 [Rubroshorea leprosula]|uniref:Uncharacterized protein n=1 Tax=Rubroshorea leprosula TaxID=152421 RepID=A0AAV5JJS0_9ROSI|nr:hypothetical protein SLEP1_g22805 [Rubroshorea leprosula]